MTKSNDGALGEWEDNLVKDNFGFDDISLLAYQLEETTI